MAHAEPAGHRRRVALGLFLSHGVLDALTTAAAALTVGAHVEANPLLTALMRQHVAPALGLMVLVTGAVALAWPRLAQWAEFPRWFGPSLVAVGLLVSLGNLAVVAAY
jgi:hypothetical protein